MHRTARRFSAVVLLAPWIAAPAGAAGEPAPLERARAAATALTEELKARLSQELERGGAVAAAGVCSSVAQTIAAAHSRDGLTVRRVSERWRNPADRPDDWERARLTELERALAAGALPEEVVETREEEGVEVLRYLRPIRVATPCLLCHGDPAGFPPELRHLLAARYSADRAVGYRVGDLRGAVSVTVRPTPEGGERP